MFSEVWICLLYTSSCTKDPATGSGQGEVSVNLTASLPTAIQSYSTKASNQGGINNVTDKTLRYILEVYDESGNFIMRKTVFKAPGAFTDPASFSLTLLAQKYKFAFWADFVASEADADLYYSTLSATDHGPVSYTHLDVYKRQRPDTAGAMRACGRVAWNGSV